MNEEVTRVTINPWNSSQMVATGKKCLKYFKMVDNGVQTSSPIQKKDLQDYTDNTWLQETLFAVATSGGDILLFSDGELIHIYSNIFGQSRTLSFLRPIPSQVQRTKVY